MIATHHTVTLRSSERFGAKAPPKSIGEFLRALPDVIRSSIRMAIESRSSAKGKLPNWLRAAADIRFVGFDGKNDTVLHFEAPQLGEAAASLYQQQELWPARPDREATGFDLLSEVIQDIRLDNCESDRFDRSLLGRIECFRKSLKQDFRSLELSRSQKNHGAAVIDSELIEAAAKLSHRTPGSQATRLFGKLDMIRSSTNAFAIKLIDNQEVRGVLVEGKIGEISKLLDHNVLLVGRAIYRPSGSLLRIDAEDVLLASKTDEFFSLPPKPRVPRLDLREVERGQQHKRGIAAIFGKWPGDETEEEVAAALRAIG